MSIHSGMGGSAPVGPERGGRSAGTEEIRFAARSSVLAVGTLACPLCDAPVDPGARRLTPRDPLSCPYCARTGPVRDFLSLTAPPRPARVQVRVVPRGRATAASG